MRNSSTSATIVVRRRSHGTWTSPGSSTKRAPGMRLRDVAAALHSRVAVVRCGGARASALDRSAGARARRLWSSSGSGRARRRGAERRAAAPREPRRSSSSASGADHRRQVDRSRPMSARARPRRARAPRTSAPRGSPRRGRERFACTSRRARAARVRSGYVAAKRMRHRTALRVAEKRARTRWPAASITARTSSIRVSRSGSPTSRSERPVPRLSKRISRANELESLEEASVTADAPGRSRGARRSRRRARGRTALRRVTWYAMLTSPLRARATDRSAHRPTKDRSRGSTEPDPGGASAGNGLPHALIGVPRFELGTSPTRTERATRLRHTPSRPQGTRSRPGWSVRRRRACSL